MTEKYATVKAQMFHFEQWLPCDDSDRLKRTIHHLLKTAGFTILNFIEHKFAVQGYTCVWLLGESHLAIHTFPNENKSYLQLSSCSEDKKAQFVAQLEQISWQ